MKETIILPSIETEVLPNNNLYCRVYKGKEVLEFNVLKEYMGDDTWLIELASESIKEYVQFYYDYLAQQLNRKIKLQGKDKAEFFQALYMVTMLIRFKLDNNKEEWATLVDKYIPRLYDKITLYEQQFEDNPEEHPFLDKVLNYSHTYFHYWYSFNKQKNMTDSSKLSFIQVVNDIISHLKYKEPEEVLFYRFEQPIKLETQITYEGKHYDQINAIVYFPFWRKLSYVCHDPTSPKYLSYVPVNTQSPMLLQSVHEQITKENP